MLELELVGAPLHDKCQTKPTDGSNKGKPPKWNAHWLLSSSGLAVCVSWNLLSNTNCGCTDLPQKRENLQIGKLRPTLKIGMLTGCWAHSASRRLCLVEPLIYPIMPRRTVVPCKKVMRCLRVGHHFSDVLPASSCCSLTSVKGSGPPRTPTNTTPWTRFR